MAEHTIKAFDEEIETLRGLIAEMGGRAEAALEHAMTALQRQDLELASQVIADDKRIDAIEAEVEKLVVQIIALRAPMANDLRDVMDRSTQEHSAIARSKSKKARQRRIDHHRHGGQDRDR